MTSGEFKELPTSFRGYDRVATDALLTQIEQSYGELLAERDDLRSRLEDAQERAAHTERELARYREQMDSISRVLIHAEEVRSAAERDAHVTRSEASRQASQTRDRAARDAQVMNREAEATKVAAEREAEEIRAAAQRRAAEVVSEALARAEQLALEARRKLEERQRQAEVLLDGAKGRLNEFVRDLFAEARAAGFDGAAGSMADTAQAADPPRPSERPPTV